MVPCFLSTTVPTRSTISPAPDVGNILSKCVRTVERMNIDPLNIFLLFSSIG